MERLDALSIREYTDRHGEVRKQYTRLGVALPHRTGNGYTILLNAMPPSVDGQYVITLFPPREDDEREEHKTASRNDDVGRGGDMDTEIPF